MKIVLTNTNLVFTRERDYVDFELAYFSGNANTGVISYAGIDYDYQYAKIGTTRKLSVSTDGVKILPNIGTGVSDGYMIYLYDNNGDYIGYGTVSSANYMQNGVLIENILNMPNGYQNASGAIDKATAIANTAYYMIGLNKIEAFATLTGKTLKIK